MTDLVLKAPEGKFRLVVVDTFDGTDFIDADYEDQQKALDNAELLGGTMSKTYVYDDTGKCIAEFGEF